MASNLFIAMTSKLIAMASNLIAMASNLVAMASNLIASHCRSSRFDFHLDMSLLRCVVAW